ncbi:MAG: phosphoribosylamine--glycine ligase [Chlorobi bacterium]|nr:phosphoribosylamine--glycine ligase [Chlorobiota bacterium]
MNILIIGSGGREHTLAWKISESPKLDKLFVAPGNAGTRAIGTNIPVDLGNFQSIKEAVIEKDIDMVIVGPEAPLVNGIHDFFLQDKILKNIPVIGPVRKGAMLEGSKDFAKDFMEKYNIPTAAHKTFNRENYKEGFEFIDMMKPPYVLKADGLAAGKGVLIVEDPDGAKNELQAMITKEKFGTASAKVLIEEFLQGIEISVFVLTDGKSYILLPEAKDYKRIGEGDTGLNTGGMGSVSPVPFANKEFMQKVEEQIIIPTIEGLQAENIEYKGFIFFGLMNVNGNPYVIEYNCRMGDPEAEVVIPRIESDLLELFEAVANGTLADTKIEIDHRVAASIMLVSEGYPLAYEKGKIISGLENVNNCVVFHAGTAMDIETGKIKTSGGRVLAVTAYGADMKEALKTAYENAEIINFDGKFYRTDIGFDLK